MTDDRVREIAVETVEMVDWSDPTNPQPSDPVFRIVLHGYIADFDSKPAAENFAEALRAYGDARAAEAGRAGREAAIREAAEAVENWHMDGLRLSHVKQRILALLDARNRPPPPEAERC
jgi:plasmid stabilization system protein ParE